LQGKSCIFPCRDFFASIRPVIKEDIVEMTVDNQGSPTQFTKTKMCKFHILGKCTKGPACPFAHDRAELRSQPDLRCTKICKTLILTGSCTNTSCSYAHGPEELRVSGAVHKTKFCRFMQNGHCARGSKCNFAHSNIELRGAQNAGNAQQAAKRSQKDKRNQSQEDLAPRAVGRIPPSSPVAAVSGGSTNSNTKDLEQLSALARSIDILIAQGNHLSQISQEAPTTASAPSLRGEFMDVPAYVHLPSADACGLRQNSTQPLTDSERLVHLLNDFLCVVERPTAPMAPPSPPHAELSNAAHFSAPELFGASEVIDQKDEILYMKNMLPTSLPLRPIRRVHTSTSTLCTLGDL